MVVGWYHSHPGFGCWLSGVDINTQQVMVVRTTLSVLAWFALHASCCSPASYLNETSHALRLFLHMQSFEQLNPRAVAVVVDPIQSVKGKVVIDAFRCVSLSI